MEKATQSDGRTGKVLCAGGGDGRGGVAARRGCRRGLTTQGFAHGIFRRVVLAGVPLMFR